MCAKRFNWKYPTIYLAHLPKSANYFWKKLLSHVHCPWYKWWKESIYQLFSWPKLLQSDVKCKTQKRQDIKNWCLLVALTQFIFLLLYFLCAYVGKTGNVTISLQHSSLVDYLAQVIWAKNCPTTFYCIFELILVPTTPTMAFPVVEFSREGYKIRQVFG